MGGRHGGPGGLMTHGYGGPKGRGSGPQFQQSQQQYGSAATATHTLHQLHQANVVQPTGYGVPRPNIAGQVHSQRGPRPPHQQQAASYQQGNGTPSAPQPQARQASKAMFNAYAGGAARPMQAPIFHASQPPVQPPLTMQPHQPTRSPIGMRPQQVHPPTPQWEQAPMRLAPIVAPHAVTTMTSRGPMPPPQAPHMPVQQQHYQRAPIHHVDPEHQQPVHRGPLPMPQQLSGMKRPAQPGMTQVRPSHNITGQVMMPSQRPTLQPLHQQPSRPSAPFQSGVMRPLSATGRGAAGRPAAGMLHPRGPSGGIAGEDRPRKRTKRELQFEREADAAANVPIVVRAPINDTERKEIEQWKAERRKHFPTGSNVARKVAEAEARRETGALDPVRQERLRKLKEVLMLQRSMGVDHIAGTTELLEGPQTSPRYGTRGGGSRFGRGRGRGGRAPYNARDFGPPSAYDAKLARELRSLDEQDAQREVAGGVTTKHQWVRDGYEGVDTSQQHAGQSRDRRGGQQQRIPGPPRKPGLLNKLLEKDIRRDHSWLLQAIRFIVRNDFLQPSHSKDGQGQELSTSIPADDSSPASILGRPVDWPPEGPEIADLAAQLPLPPPIDEDLDEDLDEGSSRPAGAAGVLQGLSDIPVMESDTRLHTDIPVFEAVETLTEAQCDDHVNINQDTYGRICEHQRSEVDQDEEVEEEEEELDFVPLDQQDMGDVQQGVLTDVADQEMEEHEADEGVCAAD